MLMLHCGRTTNDVDRPQSCHASSAKEAVERPVPLSTDARSSEVAGDEIWKIILKCANLFLEAADNKIKK
jgi:hypothetical protein